MASSNQKRKFLINLKIFEVLFEHFIGSIVFKMPMTIIGAGGTAPNQALGAEHSQPLHAYVMGIPGLKICTAAGEQPRALLNHHHSTAFHTSKRARACAVMSPR